MNTDDVFRIEIMTPERADQLVKNHQNYRLKNKTHVESILSRLREDPECLKKDGTPIRIMEKSGLLKDGQHRCSAIIELGRPVPIHIQYVKADDWWGDEGTARTASNYLAYHLGAEATHVPNRTAVSKILMACEKRDFTRFSSSIVKESNQDILECQLRWQSEITEAIKLVGSRWDSSDSGRVATGGAPTITAVALALRVDSEAITNLISRAKQVHHNDDVPGSRAATLRRHIVANGKGKANKNRKLVMMAGIAKAFDNERKNTLMKLIRVLQEGREAKDEFSQMLRILLPLN